ncbi:MAG: alpha/beta fold hydrolase, partial [Mycobacteriales bacterium]
MTSRPSWALSLPAAGEPRAVILVLYGGKSVSREPSRARHLSAARMVPVARALHRAAAPYDAEVRMVCYRYRGWNHAEASAAADAAWALAVIGAERPGLPVVVVGHSMGGRAALRVADDPAVVGVVALAPWAPSDDPVAHLAGQRIRILHGSRDRWTSPRASVALAAAAEAVGADVRFVDMGRVGHFMIRRRGRWEALTGYLVVDALLAAGLV